MFEYIQQNLGRDFAVQLDSGHLIFRETNGLLYYNQSPCTYTSHVKTGFYKALQRYIGEPLVFSASVKQIDIAQKVLLPQLFQRPPQLRLKYHHSSYCQNVDRLSGKEQYRMHPKYSSHQYKQTKEHYKMKP